MPVMMKAPRTRRTRQSSRRFEVAKTLGGRLRAFRKAQKIRLVELAKASGVDVATISRIETGKMTGTLESHMRLARGLGIKLAQLYAELEEAQARELVSVQPASARADVYVHQAGKASVTMLTPDILKKKLMPALVTIEPGGSTHKEEARVGTEKFLYVLEGELEAKIGRDLHHLKKGSTLYFDASLPHSLRNPGRKPSRCLAVTTPPAL